MLIILCQKDAANFWGTTGNVEPLRWCLAESGRRLANPLHASTLGDALTKAHQATQILTHKKIPET